MMEPWEEVIMSELFVAFRALPCFLETGVDCAVIKSVTYGYVFFCLRLHVVPHSFRFAFAVSVCSCCYVTSCLRLVYSSSYRAMSSDGCDVVTMMHVYGSLCGRMRCTSLSYTHAIMACSSTIYPSIPLHIYMVTLPFCHT